MLDENRGKITSFAIQIDVLCAESSVLFTPIHMYYQPDYGVNGQAF